MDTKFFNLEQEKQNRILNAALNEFARNGFKHASTNQMVQEAGISKGLLFHYFKNKKDLYFSLYDHFIQMFLERIQTGVDWEDRDIFRRYQQMAALKIELFYTYPDMFQFLNTVLAEDSTSIQKELEKRKNDFMNHEFKQMFQDIDVSNFKPGLDSEKTIEIINWSLEGFAYKQQAKIKGKPMDQINLQEALAELDDYIEVLKQSFYQ